MDQPCGYDFTTEHIPVECRHQKGQGHLIHHRWKAPGNHESEACAITFKHIKTIGNAFCWTVHQQRSFSRKNIFRAWKTSWMLWVKELKCSKFESWLTCKLSTFNHLRGDLKSYVYLALESIQEFWEEPADHLGLGFPRSWSCDKDSRASSLF